MKGLAFKVPYGLALFYGKNIENRSKGSKWSYQGPLLVYSSKTADRHYYDAAVPVCIRNGWTPPPFEELERGVILGVVWMGDRTWGTESKGWGFADRWHYSISNARLFSYSIPYVPAFGLGLMNIPDHVVEHEIRPTNDQQLSLF